MTRFYYWTAVRAPLLFGALLKTSTPRTDKGIDRMMNLISRGESEDAQFARSHPD